MKVYNIDSTRTMQEFFTAIIVEHDCTLDIDESFGNMANRETGSPSFTEEDAEYLDGVLQACFEYCDNNGLDIYEIAGEVQIKEYKKKGLLPENFGTE